MNNLVYFYEKREPQSFREYLNQYIVFSPNQIKFIDNRGTFDTNNPNIYWQKGELGNVVDLTDAFEKNPSIDDVKSFLGKVVNEGGLYATLSPDWVIDIKSNRRSKQHIAYSDNWKNITRQEKGRHNKYVMAFEKIINNAEYSHSRKNIKTDKKPNVLKYHYFTSEVRIGDKTYNIVLDTEQFVGENENKPQTVHLYNIKEVPASSSKTTIKKQGTPSNTIITPSDTNVKPLLQSAFAGSRVDYDKPSLEAIGSGEGAQIKENAQLAESVTITGAEGQSNDFSSDILIITPSDSSVKPNLQDQSGHPP